MKPYRIAHITDLLQIPPEHWAEAMRDIRGAMISLRLIEAAAACTPGVSFDPKENCPCIYFIPDGKGDVTPTMDGKPMLSMRITQDEAHKEALYRILAKARIAKGYMPQVEDPLSEGI